MGETNNALMKVEQKEEVLVTNGAIKTTDVLGLIGAAAFAATGITCLVKSIRKKETPDRNVTIIQSVMTNLINEGASAEEIENAKKLLEKYF